MFRSLSLLAIITLAACAPEGRAAGVTYTLYRSSAVDAGLRVHWATFDAAESDTSSNAYNCTMAARLLNANLAALAKANGNEQESELGFWCEPGNYGKESAVPSRFEAAFPTDV